MLDRGDLVKGADPLSHQAVGQLSIERKLWISSLVYVPGCVPELGKRH